MTQKLFKYFKNNEIKMGLITDGRSITQRNKIESLDIDLFLKKSLYQRNSVFQSHLLKYSIVLITKNTTVFMSLIIQVLIL